MSDMTADMLTGRSTQHLIALYGQHRLQPQAADAFLALQQAAREAGFDLQPASSFRDFTRQQTIWNGKFRGERPVLDRASQPVDITTMTEGERCLTLLHWSALPGASRHHWGSDLDIYDPALLPTGTQLRLEPWEYLPGGYFALLHQWLSEHMADFGFYRPFIGGGDGVAAEPWHLSYRPVASQAERLLTPALLLSAWQGQDIAGMNWLSSNITAVFSRFICPEDSSCSG